MAVIASFDLVGMYYHQEAFDKLDCEDGDYFGFFKLEPDPDNEKDPNAIKITCDDDIFAFVAKDDTGEVRKLLSAGTPYTVSFSKEHDSIKGFVVFREPEPVKKKKGLFGWRK